MPTDRRLKLVHGQVAWMLGAVLALSALGALSGELFLTLSVVGLLVVTELTAPANAAPAWRGRLRWFLALGLLAFGAVVIRRVLVLLPPEVVP